MRRLASLLLAVVVAVTFMPFLGDGSYADTNKKPNEKVKYIEKKADGTEVELDPEIFEGDGEILNPDDATLEKLGIGVEPEPTNPAPEELSVPAPDDDLSNADPDTLDATLSEMMDEVSGSPESSLNLLSIEVPDDETSEEATLTNASDEMVSAAEENVQIEGEVSAKAALKSQNIYMNAGTGKLHVEVHLDSTYQVQVRLADFYGTAVVADTQNAKDYTKEFDVSGLSMEYYVAAVYCRKNTSSEYEYLTGDQFKVSLYSKRPSSGGSIEVYSTYYNFMPYDFIPDGYRLYMDYAPAGGGWSTPSYMSFYFQTYTFSGLAPNTVFTTREYFGITRTVRYLNNQGQVVSGPVFFSGADTGRVLYNGTFQTGAASLPKIKSVKVKAYKVKKRRAGVYGWYTGYYFGSVKYYTYKIKVTVQFKTKKKKKKPGLNGLYINGVWKPGNKKKYTLKLGPYANYSKPKGKKFNVYLYSAHAPGGYGGYSPMYSKTKKVK